jgi:hypothetical protein
MTATMTDMTAGMVRELPGRREDAVARTGSYPGDPGMHRDQWWAGIPGLDPWFAAQDPVIAAQSASMGCAMHVLGGLYAGGGWNTRDVAAYVRDWHKWLSVPDTVSAALRRQALRLASTVRLDPEDVLPFAKAIYDGCGGR